MKKDISEMTSKELEQLLKDRKKKEAQEREKQRQKYEEERDKMVINFVNEALELHAKMASFKQRVITKLEEFRETAKEYGDVRSNSKGGFSLRRSDGEMVVVYERNVKSYYDERADMARDLIHDFLKDMVKSHDKNAYEFIQSLLVKNKQGDFHPSLIATLIKHEDRYSDDRWQKAIKLLKESLNQTDISMSVAFYVKDSQYKDSHISLSLPSIPVDDEKEQKQEGGEDVQSK